MEIKVTTDFLFVRTPYHDKEMVKTKLNGVYVKSAKMNRFPRNIHCLKELYEVYPELLRNPHFMGLMYQIQQSRKHLLALKRQQDAKGNAALRPYQRVDVNYLRNINSAGVFNEQRTGKTPTVIQTMKELATTTNIVISPASLVWNWGEECKKWYPEITVIIVSGTPTARKKLYRTYTQLPDDQKRVLIISKDTWKIDVEEWKHFTFDLCVVDEAHYLRNYATAQSKAIFAVKASHRYALTGTPTVKHAADLYGIIRFLYPKKFPSFWQFAERYFRLDTDYYGSTVLGDVKPHREAELKELVELISVQRKRRDPDVMAWLPEKDRHTIHCKLSKKQNSLYNQMVSSFFASDKESGHAVDTPNVLAQLMRLRQLCLDPRLIGFDVVGAKTVALLEWLENNTEPVVVMTNFTSYYDLVQPDIEKLGRKVGRITGRMSNKEKQESAQRFQNGELDVLLCNIESAGKGFTLDRAETMLFLDKAWNPADNEQAEDRITPVSQERNHKHTIISLVAEDTVDSKIHAILEKKKSLTSIINEGGREAVTALFT